MDFKKNIALIRKEASARRKAFGLRHTFAWGLKLFSYNKYTQHLFYNHDKNFLETKYKYVVDKYRNAKETTETMPDDAPIWVMWLQGEDAMPPIVKKCYESLKQHAAKHPVTLLNRENISQYVTVPDYVWKKMEQGKLQIQYVSDLIRNMLIAQYGGIWCEATILFTSTPAEFQHYEKPFYILMHRDPTQRWPWCEIIHMGAKGNLFNTFMADLLLEYAKNEDVQLDYFMFNYAGGVGYHGLPELQRVIDSVPNTHPNHYYYYYYHAEPFNRAKFEKAKADTSFFKTTYKFGLSNNPDSLYQHILRGDI